MSTTPATIRDWCKAAYDTSASKGFHEEGEYLSVRERLATALANISGELSEAWEAFRVGDLAAPCDKADKMSALGLHRLTCLEEELADVVLRVFDTAYSFGIDLQRAIETKHAYNQTRPYKHGGKRA